MTFEKIPGVRLKFRNDDIWFVATLWIDDTPQQELGRVLMKYIGEPGSAMHHSFVDCMSELLRVEIAGVIPADVKMKREKPRYKGE